MKKGSSKSSMCRRCQKETNIPSHLKYQWHLSGHSAGMPRSPQKILTVIYDVGLWPLDQKIETVVGQKAGASGAGLGERDLSWYNLTERKASELSEKIRQAFPDVSVVVTDDVA